MATEVIVNFSKLVSKIYRIAKIVSGEEFEYRSTKHN